ncbi:ABC transporter substrate-binding protein [Rhizobium puerariae]|uniref:ABC transporter substrate-binding protein n=1 Tax=Rhizobium puerariae TaxID=1585791 RepID=A0ABV6AUK9_9HYPH
MLERQPVLLRRAPQGDGEPDIQMVMLTNTTRHRAMPGMTRRATLGALLAAPFIPRAAMAQEGLIRATDIIGREAVLKAPAQQIVLGSWVTIDALSLIHPDPASLLVGWGGDFGANQFQLETFRKRFPAIDAVPVVGQGSIETMSIETIISQAPDLVILSRLDAFRFGDAASNPQLEQLADAGIPVAIVDFFLDPARNTEPSLRLLGTLLGRERQAQEFLDLYGQRMRRIETRLARPGVVRPTVLLHAFAARPECCWTTGPGNRDALTTPAGGHNIGADVLKGAIGQLNLEYVYEREPEFYIATGGADGRPTDEEFAIGRDVSADRVKASFEKLLARPQIAAIKAVSERRAFGVWHNFMHTPIRIAAVEALARWMHSDLFADIDAEATLEAVNARFLPVPLEGTFWVAAT